MQVEKLRDCRFVVDEQPWAFARRHQAAIATHWAAATSTNPNLFDGEMFVVNQWAVSADVLNATLLATRFSAYLYWRHIGFDAGKTNEAFATSVIQTAEGGVLLARAVAGTLNAGLFASPGGLLDVRDLTSHGFIDVGAAAEREIAEETGLATDSMDRRDGFLLARVPPFLGLASVFKSPLSGDEMLAGVGAYLGRMDTPELEAPIVVRDVDELGELEMAPHARLLTEHILS